MSKYWAILHIAFKQQRGEVAALLGRIAFYGVLLLTFSRLWQAVFTAEARSGGAGEANAFGEYVWYLAITEWVMLAQPALHLDVQSDVRNGDIAYRLGRPVSYIGSKLCEGLGELALRLLALAVPGLLFARAFSGAWPAASDLALAALLGLLASVLMLMCLLAIGLCSFWLHECTPVYLIWQKLLFVLGGLMLPLAIYPDGLRHIALWSPFAAMLNGPGQLIMGASSAFALVLALKILAWAFLAALALLWLERAGRRRIDIEGG